MESSFDEEYIKAKYQDVFWESNLKSTINLLEKADLKKKSEKLLKVLKVYTKMNKKIINLLQKAYFSKKSGTL